MSLDQISQYIIMVTGPLAVFLVGTKGKFRTAGYWVGVCSQPFWFITLIMNHQWPILIASLVYTYSWGNGVWNHCLKKEATDGKSL